MWVVSLTGRAWAKGWAGKTQATPAMLGRKEQGQHLSPQRLLVGNSDGVLNRFALRFSGRLVGAPGTSPELPVAFHSMIHAFFVVRAMEVYFAPFVNRIRFRFHGNLTLLGSFPFKSASGRKTKVKSVKGKK